MNNIKSFVSETMVYGFGNVFSKTFAFFLIPLYINNFGKIDYANLMLFQITTSVLTFLLALNAGVFYYYYNYDNPKYKKIIFTTWMYYQLFVSGILIVITALFIESLSKLYIIDNNLYELKICIVISVLKLIPYSLNSVLMNKHRIDRKPWKSILVVVLEASISFIFVSIIIFLFDGGIIHIVFGIFLARIIVSIIHFKELLNYLSCKNISFRILRKVLKYTWPFMVSSIFSWILMHIDKFVGSLTLVSKDDNAILALCTQIAMPILIFSEMIGTSLGPYIMSVKNESDSSSKYQSIFELVVISSLLFVVLLIFSSPLILELLANESYNLVLYILPMIVISRLINIIWLQFSVGFSLDGNTKYIMYSIILGGLTSLIINYLFMRDYGLIISGVSQVLSCFLMLLFIYITSLKIINFKYNFKMVRLSLFLFLVYIILYYINHFYNEILLNTIMIVANLSFILYLTSKLIKITSLNKLFFKKP